MADDLGSFCELGDIDDNEPANDSQSVSSFGEFDSNNDNIEQETSQSNPETDDINGFGLEVLRSLAENGVPPTPANYKIYFEKMLENKPAEFRETTKDLIGGELIPAERQIEFEAKILKSFRLMVNILQIIAALYKNLTFLQASINKHLKEVSATSNINIFQNIMTALEHELQKVSDVTKQQTQEIKTLYDQCAKIVESIGSNTIYDPGYGVYNRRFVDIRIENELATIKHSKHKSSLLMIKITKALEKRITDSKTAVLINKSVSKVLQKITNKSDVIGYYGSGVFAVLLSHSNKDLAKRFANRLSENISSTSLYLHNEEFTLSVSSGIFEITPEMNAKDVTKYALEALKKASNSNISFVLYGEKANA